jgi:hypothetical protein
MPRRECYVVVEDFQKQQRRYAKRDNYFESVLLPMIKEGDWSKLKEMPVAFDAEGNSVIKFGDNEWPFAKYFKTEGVVQNFEFSLLDDKEAVLSIDAVRLKAEQSLGNELKCFVIAAMHYTPKTLAISTIRGYLNSMKDLASAMLHNEVYTFEGLTLKGVRELMTLGLDMTRESISSLNFLNVTHEYLPFAMDFDVVATVSNVGAEVRQPQQYMVLPPRIYMSLLEGFSSIVNEMYKYRDDIEAASRQVVGYYERCRNRTLTSIREGRSNPAYILNDYEKCITFFEEEGVSLVDNMEDKRWEAVWHKMGMSVVIPEWYRDEFCCAIGDKVFENPAKLRNYLFELDNQCKYICLALSGMRVDELYRSSPVHGTQTVKIGGQKIHLLTTRQSKVSLNTQTKDDVYVTTEVGYKAFHILNAIHAPIRERFREEKGRMFGSVSNIASRCYAVSKHALGGSIQKVSKNSVVSLVLTQDDMKYLRISDPSQDKYTEGDEFVIHNHSLRRSLAYYLIGFELLSFPQLKQQFSHYSMAMTRWYAKNASSFKKMHDEIENERVIQQADVFARIFGKMANNERIAGGKGKAVIKEIAKQGPNYFEERDNRRKLSKLYWEKEIRGKTAHIHAIAPGMYCTNEQCSMRINIELAECADCAFDYIEDAAYAETARIDAMRNLLLAEETSALNKGLASMYVMRIKAAEKIMDDLEYGYEPFQFPEAASNLLKVS